MRVIVCGTRRWHDRERIADRLADLPSETTIVVGYNPETDSPQGADRIAYQEADKLGFLLETHPAQWHLFGKVAGFNRNRHMGYLGADLCIAFWDGSSVGTKQMMDVCKREDIPVEVIMMD